MKRKPSDPWSPLPDPAWCARSQVVRAHQVLDELEDVHEARRALKRARALVRLCVGGFPSRHEARAVRLRLRDAGRLLSEWRDREAALEVLQSLGPHAARGTDSEIAGPEEAGGGEEQAAPAATAGVGEILRETAATLEGLRGRVPRPTALEAVGRAYRRARRAYRDAEASPTAEAIHTLRKRTKDLRYQLDWLAPLWPRVLGAWVDELHALTDDLGRIQDIRIYRKEVRAERSPPARRRHARNLWALRQEGRRARRAAMSRGRKLYLESSASFGERITRLGGTP